MNEVQSSVRAVAPKEVKSIPVDQIIIGHRFRQKLGDVDALKSSIQQNGLIHNIVVKETVDGKYQLMAGGRRIHACKELGWNEITCNVYPSDLSQLERNIIELCENVDRKDMEYEEQVALTNQIDIAMKKLHGEKVGGRHTVGHSYKDTATMLGQSISTVSQDIQLAKAIEVMPELGKLKNKAEAVKTMNKLVSEHRRAEIAETIEKKRAITPIDKRKKLLIDSYIVGDFFKEVGAVQSGSIDFVEVDTPFGIDLDKKKKGVKVDHYDEWDVDEFREKISNVATECYRVMSDNSWIVWWFGPEPWFETVYDVLTNAGFVGNRLAGIWTKPGGQTMQPNYYMANSYEPFFYMRKGSPAIVRQGRSNVFNFRPVSPESKIHSTEKPIEMLNDIFSIFIEPGRRAMIPFLGSGNSILACYNIGCTAFGWDLSRETKDAYVVRVGNSDGKFFKSGR